MDTSNSPQAGPSSNSSSERQAGPSTSTSPSPIAPTAKSSTKRRRTSQASSRSAYSCIKCQIRKVKCDRQQNCSNCRRRGDVCVWASNAQPEVGPSEPRRAQDGGTVEVLTDRIRRLEAMIMNQGSGSQMDQGMQQPYRGGSGSQVGHGHYSSYSDVRDRETLNQPPRWRVPPPIEHLVQKSPQDRNGNHVGIHDSFDHQIIAASNTDGQDEDAPSAWKEGYQEDEYEAAARTAQYRLPPKRICDALVDFYLERLEWVHHVLDVPQFYEWYSSIWRRPASNRTDLLQTALVFAMMSVSYHFDDESSTRALNYSGTRVDARTLYRESQQALTAADYLQHRSPITIQTLIIQCLYLNDIGEGETHHTNLAIASRIAALCGFFKIDFPTLSRGSEGKDKFGGGESKPTLSTKEEEMGRRLFWCITSHDAFNASACDFTYSVPTNQIHCKKPHNLRDDELDRDPDAPEWRRESHHPPTPMSYHIVKLPFSMTARKVVDLYNEGKLNYTAVLDLDREYRSHFRALPEYLRPDRREDSEIIAQRYPLGWGKGFDGPLADDSSSSSTLKKRAQRVFALQIQWSRLFLGITLHNRLMRLHRPYMVRAYQDSTFIKSKTAALTAAVELLKLVERGRRINIPVLRWWAVLVHIFTAAVVLCIDRYFQSAHGDRGRSAESIEREELLLLAIDTLASAAKRSQAAKQALDIVQSLMKQSNPIRSAATKRRHVRVGSDTSVSVSRGYVEQRSPRVVTPSASGTGWPANSMAAPVGAAGGSAFSSASGQSPQSPSSHFMRTPDSLSTLPGPDFDPTMAVAAVTTGSTVSSDSFTSPTATLPFSAASTTTNNVTSGTSDWLNMGDWANFLGSSIDAGGSLSGPLSVDLYHAIEEFVNTDHARGMGESQV